MQRVRLVVLMLLAASMFSAVVAAAASAALPEILNSRREVAGAVRFSGSTSAATRLSTLGSSVEVTCATTRTEGEFEARRSVGPYHLMFERCTTTAGGTCTGLGEASGVILELGTIHLEIDARPLLYLALWYLIQNTHFECTVLIVHKLILMLGQLLCLVTPSNRLTIRASITCETTGTLGDPGQTAYLNDEEREVNIANGLLSSENDSTFTMSAESGAGEVEFGEEIELMT